MAQNLPCKDLARGGERAKDTAHDTAMSATTINRTPPRPIQGSVMPGRDASDPSVTAVGGVDAASLRHVERLNLLQICRVPIAKVSLLASSKLAHRGGRRRAELKARGVKLTSFRPTCQFDEDGLRLLQSEAELQKIFSVVHYHEGAQTLHGIVKEIVSPRSPNGIAAGLLQKCRDLVRGCESCQMCRRMPGKRHSKELRKLDKREFARSPIRISFHGEEVKLSPSEVAELRRHILKPSAREGLPPRGRKLGGLLASNAPASLDVTCSR